VTGICADLERATRRDCDLVEATLVDSALAGATLWRLAQAKLRGAILEHCELTGSDPSGAPGSTAIRRTPAP
jgi:uncharacterized protein YjbI with pentapeptide repeats